jgi:hypothetical protein
MGRRRDRRRRPAKESDVQVPSIIRPSQTSDVSRPPSEPTAEMGNLPPVTPHRDDADELVASPATNDPSLALSRLPPVTPQSAGRDDVDELDASPATNDPSLDLSRLQESLRMITAHIHSQQQESSIRRPTRISGQSDVSKDGASLGSHRSHRSGQSSRSSSTRHEVRSLITRSVASGRYEDLLNINQVVPWDTESFLYVLLEKSFKLDVVYLVNIGDVPDSIHSAGRIDDVPPPQTR